MNLRLSLFLSILVGFFLTTPSSSYAQPPLLPTVRLVCSQCHALRINQDCVAGDCRTVRVFPTVSRQWLPFVNWIRRSIGCRMSDAQQQAIIYELTQHYPAPVIPLSWKENPSIPLVGRVTALLTLRETRYIGTDRGKILQWSSKEGWRTVADVGPMTLSALTVFQDTLYAVTNLPRAEVWSSQDGTTWEKVVDLTEIAGGLVTLHVSDNQLYAGTSQGTVLRSFDGVTWSPLPTIAKGQARAWVSVLQDYKGFLYAGLALGDLFRTQPGKLWETTSYPQSLDPSAMGIGIKAASIFRGQFFVGPTTRAEVWKTDGVHWQKVFDAGPGQQSGSVAALTVMGDALYAAMTLPDQTSHLYRTRNGILWEEIALPYPNSRIQKLIGLSDRLVAAVQGGERIQVFELLESAPAPRQQEYVVYAAPGTQEHPSIASDGENVFMIWHSQEEGKATILYDIYGALLDPKGQPKGTVPIKISTARESQAWSNLTYGGGYYFAVWTDSRHNRFDVYGARIDRKGRVMDPDAIPIALGKGEDHEFAEVAWDGQNFLVVWHQTKGPKDPNRYEIYGRRVKPDGTLLDPKPFPIATGPLDQTFPQIASTGKQSLVVWTDRRRAEEDIFAARIDASGKVLDPDGIPVATAPNNQNYPTVAWNGRHYLVAWIDQRDSAIHAARISTEGEVLDPEGLAISKALTVHAFSDVACDKKGMCIVIWEQTSPVPGERDVRAAWVSPDGHVMGAESLAVSLYPGQQRFSTVYPLPKNQGFLAAWEDFPIWDTGDIYAKVLTFPR